MIQYSIDMLSIPTQQITEQAIIIQNESKLKQQHRADALNSNKSEANLNSVDLAAKGNLNQNLKENEAQSPDDINVDVFCAGNQDMINLVAYINNKLRLQKLNFLEKTQQHNEQVLGGEEEQKIPKEDSKRKSKINFKKIFSLDSESVQNRQKLYLGTNSGIQISQLNIEGNQNGHQDKNRNQSTKFTYFVENEKILSSQMFFVDSQRQDFVEQLQQLKLLLSNFIKRKYKDCITKIGFSSEKQLFNIFQKMLSSSKGYFTKINVRKILLQFWLSIQDVLSNIKIRNASTQNFKSKTNNLDQNINFLSLILGQELNKLSKYDEIILNNNFYLRLEIISRGRYIYESFDNLENENKLGNWQAYKGDSGISQGSVIGGCDKASTNSLPSNWFPNNQNLYPIHKAVFESNLRQLSRLLKFEEEGIFFTEKNQLDPCGNTPLMLAVKLNNSDAIKILSDMYTCPKLRPLQELMNAKEIAIGMKNPQILKILMSSNQKIKQQFFEQNKNAIFNVLEKIPDFKVDLCLTCDSNWFPLFSSVAPSDTYKIYKQGSNLRLDMTLLGLQKFNLIKGNMSVLYKGRNSGENEGELLIVDNKLQTVNSVFNRNQESKINNEIQDILLDKQILKKFQTHSVFIDVETDRYGNPITKKINNFESQKYTLRSRYTMIKYQMNLAQIDQIKGLKSFDEYIEALQIDFINIIETSLDQISYERGDEKNNQDLTGNKNGLSKFIKQKFGLNENQQINQGPLTQRIYLRGNSQKMQAQEGYSSRDNNDQLQSNLVDLYAIQQSQQQQVHTQEDQISKNDRMYKNMSANGKDSQKQNVVKKDIQSKNCLLLGNKQITIKKKQQKQVLANLWLSREYPFNIEQYLPLIHILSFCSKQIRQFNKFLLKYQLPHSSKCFPVEARIPLFMTMEAVFSFKNLQMDFNDMAVFDIDKEVSIKQSQNMAIYAKQQISYLNLHSIVDTQEDKQSKALKEIYKLCKTDEGDKYGDYYYGNQDLYKIIDEKNQTCKKEDHVGEKAIDEESDNSDKIKELFNKMITKEDEQNENDLQFNLQNDCQENLLNIQDHEISGKRNEIDNDQAPQTLKFMSKDCQEIKVNFTNNLSHNELLLLRKGLKSNQFIAAHNETMRNVSKQFSLHSDPTESIDVSEKSFNNKLVKLQIHSFQNVKFMGQFKKQKPERFEGDARYGDIFVGSSNYQSKTNNQVQPVVKLHQLLVNQNDLYSDQATAQLQEENQQKAITHEQMNHQKKVSNYSDLSNHSYFSSSMNQGENIYDSKINEQRPVINKSFGKHQINNNVHLLSQNGTKVSNNIKPHKYKIENGAQILESSNNSQQTFQSDLICKGKQQAFDKQQLSQIPVKESKMGNHTKNQADIAQVQRVTLNSAITSNEPQPKFISRQKNQINFNQSQAQNMAGSQVVINKPNNQLETGNSMSSSVNGILQSMSSFLSVPQNRNTQASSKNAYDMQHEPSSTVDSSLHNIHINSDPGSMGSISMKQQEKQDLVFAAAQSSSAGVQYRSNKQMVDQNKLKLILENLRNDYSENGVNKKQGFQKPRYLNTIESEGNMQSYQQQTMTLGQILLSKASGNQLSERSIPSQSEDSDDRKQIELRLSQERISAEDQDGIDSESFYGKFINQPVKEGANRKATYQQEGSANVPMHTGDVFSQYSVCDNQEHFDNPTDSQFQEYHSFNYEKQHRFDSLNLLLTEKKNQSFKDNAYYQIKTKNDTVTDKRQESNSLQPQTNKHLQLNVQQCVAGSVFTSNRNKIDNFKLNASSDQNDKLSFFQKIQMFIQESITERKNYNPNIHQNQKDLQGITSLRQIDNNDRRSNEDTLFSENLSSIQTNKQSSVQLIGHRSLTQKNISNSQNPQKPQSIKTFIPNEIQRNNNL